MEKYITGLDMNRFRHIPEISEYNHNYYIGFDKDLLFGRSDDVNTTEWWLISGTESAYLGESYCSENEKLYRYDSRRT